MRNWHRRLSLKTGEFLKKKAECFIGNRRGCLLRENGRKKTQGGKAKLELWLDLTSNKYEKIGSRKV